jgi:hypothetical protein
MVKITQNFVALPLSSYAAFYAQIVKGTVNIICTETPDIPAEYLTQSGNIKWFTAIRNNNSGIAANTAPANAKDVAIAQISNTPVYGSIFIFKNNNAIAHPMALDEVLAKIKLISFPIGASITVNLVDCKFE